jgi:hypothetical protein
LSIVLGHNYVAMPTLGIDFQDGFTGETAVLRVDGKEIYRGQPRTRTQIGRADTRIFELPAQSVTLEFELAAKNARKSLSVDLSRDQYIGINLDPSGSVSFRTSSTPFGYV